MSIFCSNKDKDDCYDQYDSKYQQKLIQAPIRRFAGYFITKLFRKTKKRAFWLSFMFFDGILNPTRTSQAIPFYSLFRPLWQNRLRRFARSFITKLFRKTKKRAKRLSFSFYGEGGIRTHVWLPTN